VTNHDGTLPASARLCREGASPMSRRRRFVSLLFACLALCAAVLVVPGRGMEAVSMVRFAHDPHIANDGRIAFAWHDDIWVANADGSSATRLTNHLGNDFGPRFSPDGRTVAFTSNRYGNNDVFVIPAGGGAPRQ